MQLSHLQAWLPIILSAIGLLAEHVWATNRMARIEALNAFERSVDQPVGKLRQSITYIAIDVAEWRYGRGELELNKIRYSWARLSRDINRLIIDLSEREDKLVWIHITTDDADSAFADADDDRRELSSNTIINELNRLERVLTKAVSEARNCKK